MSFKRHKNLRVLHLPVNIRWIMDATIKGEEEIGIETRRMLVSQDGLEGGRSDRIDLIPSFSGTRCSFAYIKHLISIIKFIGHYARLVYWADVVHWQYSLRLWSGSRFPSGFDFFLLKLFRKPAVVQFHGGDFRNSAEWIKTNPWWSEAYDPEFMVNLNKRAEATQRDFGEAEFCFALGVGMYPFVKEENKHRSIVVERAIVLDTQHPRKGYNRTKLKVVHAPSHPTSKGTRYILSAMESLQKEYDIEFVLLENMDHETVLRQLSEADIVIDQLLCGDYGLLAVEAMNAGATVIANVNEVLRTQYPDMLPIVQADPENIRMVLEDLICHPERCEVIGKQGPNYAKRVHGHRAVLPDVLRGYELAAELKNRTLTKNKIEKLFDIAKERSLR